MLNSGYKNFKFGVDGIVLEHFRIFLRKFSCGIHWKANLSLLLLYPHQIFDWGEAHSHRCQGPEVSSLPKFLMSIPAMTNPPRYLPSVGPFAQATSIFLVSTSDILVALDSIGL